MFTVDILYYTLMLSGEKNRKGIDTFLLSSEKGTYFALVLVFVMSTKKKHKD